MGPHNVGRRFCGVQAVFAAGENLDGGGIHFRRAFESPKGFRRPPGGGTQNKMHDISRAFCFGGDG